MGKKYFLNIGNYVRLRNRSGSSFRQYEIDVVLNGERFSEVWIDPHYEEKHAASINDPLILNLMKELWRQKIVIVSEGIEYRYYEANMDFEGKSYRLILVIPYHKSYLGVRNAYRRSK